MSIFFALAVVAIGCLLLGYIFGWTSGWNKHRKLFWPLLENEQRASVREMQILKAHLEAVGVPVNGEPERRN